MSYLDGGSGIRDELEPELHGNAAAQEPRTDDDGAVSDPNHLRELLHDLNNALAAILLNAQIIEWKLPSYSILRRHLHAVQRNAQWGGLLVKRLRTGWDMESGMDNAARAIGTFVSDGESPKTLGQT